MINKKLFSFMLVTLFSLTMIPGKIFAMEKKEKEENCVICFEPLLENTIKLTCVQKKAIVNDHKFHIDCIAPVNNCPICRAPIRNEDREKLESAKKKFLDKREKKNNLIGEANLYFDANENIKNNILEDLNEIELKSEAVLAIEERVENLKAGLEFQMLPFFKTEEDKAEQRHRIADWLTDITQAIDQLKEALKPKQPNPGTKLQSNPEENPEEPIICIECLENIDATLTDINDPGFKVEHEGINFHKHCLEQQIERNKRRENPQMLRPECRICHNRILNDDNLKQTQCNHQFHTNCLHNYIINNACINECPICENEEALSEKDYNDMLIKRAIDSENEKKKRLEQAKKKKSEEEYKKFKKREKKKREERLRKEQKEESKKLKEERKKVQEELQPRLQGNNNSGGNNGGGNNGSWFWPMAKVSFYATGLLIAIIVAKRWLA